MQFIINEYKYIKNIIDTNSIPKGLSKYLLIKLLAKYYKLEDNDIDSIISKIKAQMSKFKFDSLEYQEYKWIKTITKIVKDILLDDSKIKTDDKILLYKSEQKIIKSCKNDREKKILFVMYILSKYNNTDGWINCELRDVFKLANISISIDRQNELIRSLLEMNVISSSKMSDNLNFKVPLINISDNEEIVLEITNVENLGNQYLGKFKEGYKQCESCGKIIKITNNKRKYCTKCYKIINCEMTNSRQKIKKDSENFL